MITGPMCTYMGITGNLCNMLYTVVFPWLLTFAIIFGILAKTQIFGSDKSARGVSGLVALAIGFFVTVSGGGTVMGAFFAASSANLMILLMGMLGVLLVIGFVSGGTVLNQGNGPKAIALIVAIAAIGWLGVTGGLKGNLMSGDFAAIALILIVIGGMWWFVGMGGDSGGGGPKPPK